MSLKTATFTYTTVPEYLQTWAFSKVKQHRHAGCHICTALYTKNLLTKNELDTFSKLTFWGLKNRETFTTFYRSYFGKIVSLWTEKATNEEWKSLQDWAKRVLGLIKTENYERAFSLFTRQVVEINEKVNSSLELYTAPELNCYLGATKSVSVTC